MNTLSPASPDEPEENDTEQSSIPDNESHHGDPFDLESLRLRQDFTSTYESRRLITTVPCRKPPKQAYVRTRPGDDWKLETALFKDEVSNEMYLVDRTLHAELSDEITPHCLFTTITRQGDLFLWPVRIPEDEGRTCDWFDSAFRAATAAQTDWVRVKANMSAQAYDTRIAEGNLPEPEWPEIEFGEIVRICFHDRFIRDMSHPILQSLRGEI